MTKILTITIPTYNVEKYLEQCLNSFIIPEILQDLEVLIVNDGSTDSSAEIAKKYTEKYPDTFILIEKENGGHGSTINTGIAAANGKYFKVVDSDDWVDENAMLHLVEALKKDDADLVFSNYYWVDNDTGRQTVEFEKPFSDVKYNKKYMMNELPHDIFLKMHGYTIRTDILRKIQKIDEHCFYVDMEYVVFPIPYIETVKFIPDFVYLYRVGLPGQSMNAEKMKRNSKNFDRVFNRLIKFYDEQVSMGLSEMKKSYMEHVLARLFASRIKIYLSFPFSRKIFSEMKKLDKYIKINYTCIYNANINKAVKMLRRTGYLAYPAAKISYRVQHKK